MFHNDLSVLTKYWAKIWWNPKNKTFQEVVVFKNRRHLTTAKSLRGALSDSAEVAFSFTLLKKVQNYV